MQRPVRWIRLALEVPRTGWAESVEFWSAVTGWGPTANLTSGDHAVGLAPESGDGWLTLQPTSSKHPTIRLELESADSEAAVQHAVGLGASERRAPGTLTSPGGMGFRFTPAAASRRFDRAGLEYVLDQVCLDIPWRLWIVEVAFWEALIGQGALTRGRPEFARLVDPDPQGRVRILLQRLETPHGSVQGHLDFGVAKRQAETARHIALGAQEVKVMERWTVMRAPDAVTYCLTDRDPTTGRAAG